MGYVYNNKHIISYLKASITNCSAPQVIDVDHSSVDLLGTKAEVKLKKADPVKWATLELKPPKPPASEDDNKTEDNTE